MIHQNSSPHVGPPTSLRSDRQQCHHHHRRPGGSATSARAWANASSSASRPTASPLQPSSSAPWQQNGDRCWRGARDTCRGLAGDLRGVSRCPPHPYIVRSSRSEGVNPLPQEQVVWGEQDSFQHVNNVTYIRYAESARVNWATHFAVQAPVKKPEEKKAWQELMTPRGTGLILKSIKCDFKFVRLSPRPQVVVIRTIALETKHKTTSNRISSRSQ